MKQGGRPAANTPEIIITLIRIYSTMVHEEPPIKPGKKRKTSPRTKRAPSNKKKKMTWYMKMTYVLYSSKKGLSKQETTIGTIYTIPKRIEAAKLNSTPKFEPSVPLIPIMIAQTTNETHRARNTYKHPYCPQPFTLERFSGVSSSMIILKVFIIILDLA